MNKQLMEANYSLKTPTNLASFINTVISWRLVDLFIKNKTQLDRINNSFIDVAEFLETSTTGIQCGFSINSNVGGMGVADASDVEVEELPIDSDASKEIKQGDVVYHHTHGTHKNDEVIPLSSKLHAKLHSEIKKLYKEAILKNKDLDNIYKDFVHNHKAAGKDSYTAFGNRIKAFEVTLIRIAKEIVDLLEEDERSKIYLAALDELVDQGLIDKNKITTLRKLKNNNKNNIAKSTGKLNSVSEEFLLHKSLLSVPPEKLYHATYKQFLKSIQQKGLGNTKRKMWSDSVRGVVYLADDPWVAESYAETSEFLEDREDADDFLDNIIILEVDISKLDINKLEIDKNVLLGEGEANSTWEYHGIIPWEACKIFNSNIAEDFKLYESLWDEEASLAEPEEKLIELFWDGIRGYSSDLWFDSSTKEKEEILWRALEQLEEPINRDRAVELFWEWADGLEEDSFIDFNI